MYVSSLNDDNLTRINNQESIDPFSEYHISKYRDDLLKWVQSLNFIHQTNSNNNNNNNKQ